MLDRFTIRPHFWAVMCFCTARVMRNEPRRCTFSTESQSSSVILKIRLSRVMPALFTSTVGGPSSSATFATAASTCSVLLTSRPTPTARPPPEARSSAPDLTAEESRSSRPTANPSADSLLATAAPIPRPAPVTIATREWDSVTCFLLDGES